MTNSQQLAVSQFSVNHPVITWSPDSLPVQAGETRLAPWWPLIITGMD